MQNKKVLLGISGGIAAYKSVSLLRSLQKEGAEVRVLCTEASLNFVGKSTWSALTQYHVGIDTWESHTSEFAHIDLARWADIFVVAPATANTMACLAHGLTPNLLSLCYLACKAPKIIVPAMNTVMLQAGPTERALTALVKDGVKIVEPEHGLMACGEIGEGRYPSESSILEAIQQTFYQAPNGKKVLLTAGRTIEPIDPVRYISNQSSGKTALALAESFLAEGYHVEVVSGPVDIHWPAAVSLHKVRSAQEMFDACQTPFITADVFVACAAVADFTPSQVSPTKIKGSGDLTNIPLTKNPDILAHLGQSKDQTIVVGFALETENVLANGQQKLTDKNCDLLVFNAPVASHSGFGKNQVEVGVLSAQGIELDFAERSKTELASALVQLVEARL
jgi:phosphopantothenoylcysteine decarboxylase/phosphopantothenate--cysteine ligase